MKKFVKKSVLMNVFNYIQDAIKYVYQQTQFAAIGSYSIVVQSFPFVVLATTAYWFLRCAWHKHKFGRYFKEIRKKSRLNEALRLLLVFWLMQLAAVTITPFDFWENIWIAMAGIEDIPIIGEMPPTFTYDFSFIPSAYYYISGEQGINFRIVFMLIGNIAAFIPLGFALPIIGRHMQFPLTLLTGASLSLIIELIQPFLYGRSGDIDDLLCNTLGVVMGYLLYLMIKKLFPKFVENGKRTAKDVWLESLNAEQETTGETSV